MITSATVDAKYFGLRNRAWVLFNGATGAIIRSSGIASVVRNAAGDYTITPTVAMSSVYYVTDFDHDASPQGATPNFSESRGIRTLTLSKTAAALQIGYSNGAALADIGTAKVAFYQ